MRRGGNIRHTRQRNRGCFIYCKQADLPTRPCSARAGMQPWWRSRWRRRWCRTRTAGRGTRCQPPPFLAALGSCYLYANQSVLCWKKGRGHAPAPQHKRARVEDRQQARVDEAAVQDHLQVREPVPQVPVEQQRVQAGEQQQELVPAHAGVDWDVQHDVAEGQHVRDCLEHVGLRGDGGHHARCRGACLAHLGAAQ